MPERDRRRDEDDEDDRPRRRRRDEDDEDDERPSRNRREEEYEEERPRKRRRFNDDDDDDRPRRRRRDGKKSNTLLIVGIALGLLFLCAIPAGIGLLLPAVSKVREAAGRAKDGNNLKQMALGALNQESSNGGIQVPYAYENRTTPNTNLSFRVGLLPFIEQGQLYNQFDLTKAWNNSRNLSASGTVVPTYISPFDQDQNSLVTPYRAFVGGGAMFNEDGSMVHMSDIKDGTGNTIMFFHSAEEVPWAKPQEIPYGPGLPLPQVGTARMATGTNVAMADGSVKFLRKDISERTLRALITRDGNDVPGNDFP
jgi:prepilin-type processing-associated H-X9-DG protein